MGKAAGRQLYCMNYGGDVFFCDGMGDVSILRFKDVAVGDTVHVDTDLDAAASAGAAPDDADPTIRASVRVTSTAPTARIRRGIGPMSVLPLVARVTSPSSPPTTSGHGCTRR